MFADIVPTCAISFLPEISLLFFFNSSQIALTAKSIPRFKSIGFAPAVTFLKPSLTIACANTVAVVVPSPATSFVFEATSFRVCAPRFSIGSSSSISFATVTPSFVTVGEPNSFSMITFLPFGPNVTFTASASLSTPCFSAERASTSNEIIFADIV